MDYYSRVKPLLNKLQKMNLLENLQEIHDDLRYYFYSSNNRSLHGMSNNLVQPYIADFLIANTLIYSNLNSKLSLRTDRIRYAVCSPLIDIHNEVSERLMKKAPATWVNSYMYNQALMQIYDDPRAMLYRYYFLYNTPLLSLNSATLLQI